ncbi:MAG: hypothetical protein ACI9G1_001100 [Pirellulaceae bacterium]|jgi:hypothetical protein
MKGPYERSKYDFHRVWECPQCHQRERSTGGATYAFCAKKQNGILCDAPMTLAEDEPRLRIHAANGINNAVERTIEPSRTDVKRNRTPNRLSPTGELKSDVEPAEMLETVVEVAVETIFAPPPELPSVAPNRPDLESKFDEATAEAVKGDATSERTSDEKAADPAGDAKTNKPQTPSKKKRRGGRRNSKGGGKSS